LNLAIIGKWRIASAPVAHAKVAGIIALAMQRSLEPDRLGEIVKQFNPSRESVSINKSEADSRARMEFWSLPSEPIAL
jgi:hypothetical protein